MKLFIQPRNRHPDKEKPNRYGQSRKKVKNFSYIQTGFDLSAGNFA